MNAQQYHFPFHIFRAYDIRGNIDVLCPSVVAAIADALVHQFKQAHQFQIVLGYDARLTSADYAAIMTQRFEAQGMQVLQIGCCSSPMMYFSAQQTAGNGIMITASHNPKSDNGIKWILNGLPPCPEKIQQIANLAYRYLDLNSITDPPEYTQIQYEARFQYAYQDYLTTDIHFKRRFKVVVDGLHGSAGHCAKLILKQLGCEVIAIRCHADGNFPDHAPDPSKAIHLHQLKQAVINAQADVGIALDGDGDRVVLLDESAHIITADRFIAVCAEICLARHPWHEIVYDVKCSAMINAVVKAMNGIPVMLRTGSSFLRQYIAKSNGNAVFGGEFAGHYVFNDGRGLGYDDGLYAALRVLEYLSQFPDLKISQLFEKYPERTSTEDTYISTYQFDPQLVLDTVAAKSHTLNAKLSKIDGVRLDFEDGFGIIRASNTGEYFTVRFDAQSPVHLNHIRSVFAAMLSDQYPQIAQDILDAQ
ncbi:MULTISPECIES: phosphomannomutase/phosphoglucomutase [unclassified Acinetobacter]|uniref:phosphomannomutase/phosphoglucomutase n=1 Tax=unclassified Acinetobacter TaxID=196816 RepID=UPI002934BB17|nr:MULTISPECIES: phosphomannomutase/phosphoglucomutase [unclassified Acinetobacter]WOE32988.1 phosphomannomutase/phosphoglucomutase [Acinetobacter sp. SAAs470]WOE38466.1 phosphomannomutase/phosphoglucomutase [Acinetobacter sp. SAAs474]